MGVGSGRIPIVNDIHGETAVNKKELECGRSEGRAQSDSDSNLQIKEHT